METAASFGFLIPIMNFALSFCDSDTWFGRKCVMASRLVSAKKVLHFAIIDYYTIGYDVISTSGYQYDPILTEAIWWISTSCPSRNSQQLFYNTCTSNDTYSKVIDH